MGIQGLLPLLKPVHEWRDMGDFAGQTIAIDAYVWLHKGAFGCAEDLVLDRPTTKFVDYCMHRVRLMQHHGVRPYVVFDGGPLPAKARTEGDRLEKRTAARARALALQQQGRAKEAFLAFAGAVDVSPLMALQFIKALRAENVPYLVAPYEADAQLAYLAQRGLVDGVLTEDSDLLVYGVPAVLFKMDGEGRVCVVHRARLGLAGEQGEAARGGGGLREWRMDGWGDDQFRHMAILSGCDYLPSIPGIGLKKAHGLLRKFRTVGRTVQHLRLEGYPVPADYAEGFRRAELTFCHQRVWDPDRAEVVPLTPLPEGFRAEDDQFIGPPIDHPTAAAIAAGDTCPVTRRPIVDDRWHAFRPVALAGPASASSRAKGGGAAASGSGNGGGGGRGAAQRKISDMFKPAPKPTQQSTTSASSSTLRRSVSAPQPRPPRAPAPSRLHQYAFRPDGQPADRLSTSSGRARLSQLDQGPSLSTMSATARGKLRASGEEIDDGGGAVPESQVLEEPGPTPAPALASAEGNGGASRFFGSGARRRAPLPGLVKAVSDGGGPRSDAACSVLSDDDGVSVRVDVGSAGWPSSLASAVGESSHPTYGAHLEGPSSSFSTGRGGSLAPLARCASYPDGSPSPVKRQTTTTPTTQQRDDLVSSPAVGTGRHRSPSAGMSISSDGGYISSSPAAAGRRPARGRVGNDPDRDGQASPPSSDDTIRNALDLRPICHPSSPLAGGPQPRPPALGQLQFAQPVLQRRPASAAPLSDSSNLRSDELDDDDDDGRGQGREQRIATIAAGWKEKFSLKRPVGRQSLPGLAMASTTTPLARQRARMTTSAASAPRALGGGSTTTAGPSLHRAPALGRSALRPPTFHLSPKAAAAGGKENVVAPSPRMVGRDRRQGKLAGPPSPSPTRRPSKRPSDLDRPPPARPAKRRSLDHAPPIPTSSGDEAGGLEPPLSSGSRSRLERLRFRPTQ